MKVINKSNVSTIRRSRNIKIISKIPGILDSSGIEGLVSVEEVERRGRGGRVVVNGPRTVTTQKSIITSNTTIRTPKREGNSVIISSKIHIRGGVSTCTSENNGGGGWGYREREGARGGEGGENSGVGTLRGEETGSAAERSQVDSRGVPGNSRRGVRVSGVVGDLFRGNGGPGLSRNTSNTIQSERDRSRNS